MKLTSFHLALFVAMALPLHATSPAGKSQQLTSSAEVPKGLAKSDWSSIRAAYEAGRHQVSAVDGGHQARNPGQQWTTKFDGRGFVTQPDAGGWQWGFELQSYGFEGSEHALAAKPAVQAVGPRVTYDWDATVQEWFINDQRGLEHGFTVKERPSVDSSLNAQPATLNFLLAVRGTLRPVLTADAQGVQFQDEHGTTVLTYAGLKVWDADGKTLPSHFASATTDNTVRLLVDERGARYPITVDPIAQQAYLKASNTDNFDSFGVSVAVSGDTVVVGAYREGGSGTGVNPLSDELAPEAGAAYVFVRSGTSWSQQAYLKASNAGSSDHFGSSVAVSGDTIVVGAPGEDSNAIGVNGNQADNSASAAGAAYVFTRSGTVWTQQAYLKASNTGANDFFGDPVAISGDTVVVGASWEESNATGVNGNGTNNSASGAGAAYVFTRSGTVWTQQAYLKASNTDAFDLFGNSVAVSGDTVIVGAHDEDSSATGVNGNESDNSASFSGAAYVFTRSGTVWTQQAYLKASNTGADDYFGDSVAVSGDTVVVGASWEESNATGVNGNETDNSANSAGAAYVFTRIGTVWTQQAYLKASNTEAEDHFGISVAVAGDTVVVGAESESSNTTGVNGNESDNSASFSGAAYVFTRSGTAWTQQAYLKASNTSQYNIFGYSVAVAGDTVLVGAFSESSNATGVNGNEMDTSAPGAGAAYIFTVLRPEIAASATGGPLGSVLLDGGSRDLGVVSVGSTSDLTFTLLNLGDADLTLTGTPKVQITGADATMFSITSQPTSPITGPSGSTTFTLRFAPTSAGAKSAALSIPNNDSDEDPFDVIITGTGQAPEIAVEQSAVDIPDGGSKDLGSVFVGSTSDFSFTIKNTGAADLTLIGTPMVQVTGADAAMFTVTAQPTSPVSGPSGSTTFTVRFAPISAGAKSAALSIANNDTNESTFDINLTGSAPPPLTAAAQQAYLKASNVGNFNRFGDPVAVSGDTAVVGSWENGADVFVRSGSTWTFQAHLTGLNTEYDDTFGQSVAISGDTIIIGAINEDGSGSGANPVVDELADGSGAAYVFVRSGTTWTQQAYLKASNTGANDHFGYSVSVSDNTVVVGASYEASSTTGVNSAPDELAVRAGAAYVFTRSGTTWSQQAYLKASNTGAEDQFGLSVAVSNDRVVVGAFGEDGSSVGVNPVSDELATSAGAAYVFVRNGVTWSQEAYLKAANTGTGDNFGASVAITLDDTVIIGAAGEKGSGVGVNPASDELALGAGAAYVFVRSGAAWSQQAYLKASNTDSSDQFGNSVSVSGDVAVIGAHFESSSGMGVNPASNNSAVYAGAAYVFVRSGLNWSQQAYLKASNTDSQDAFGRSVAVSGGTVIIGAPYEDGNGSGVNPPSNELGFTSGAAYIFAGFGLPEIAVAQSAVNIADGGSKDFGNVSIGNPADLTFTITNTGLADLHLDPITFSGTDAAMFSVTVQPASTVSAVTGSTTFTVRLTSTSLGAKTATLSFVNDDTDENPFDINLTGNALPSEIAVEQSAVDIPSGGSKDFGAVLVSDTAHKTFLIKNTGVGSLVLTGSPFVQITGADAVMFTVVTQPGSPIGSPLSTTFSVQFAPTSAGLKAATLTIPNNDPDEGAFVINLTGTGESGDIAASFSTLSNPHSSWSYGYTTTLGSTFNVYSDQGVFLGLDEWHSNAIGSPPWVTHNATAAAISFSTASVEAGALSLHPGPSGQYSVVRYTAPAAGFYRVAGSFYSQDIFGSPKDVHVLRNGVAVFDGAVNGYGPSSVVPYDVVMQLAAGETLDLAVGYGSDFNYAFDTTGLSGVITIATGSAITVLGNNVSIADGDTTPSVTDHTDFGAVLPASGSVVRTFTITNTGPANLTLGAVTISGANASDFALTTAPTSPITSGNSTTFQITFDPSDVGPRTATVSFNTNDANKGIFDFSIQGRGIGPGEVDPTFTASGNSAVYCTATQPDGKTIVGGPFGSMLGITRYGIARLNVDGTLDAGFDPHVNSGGYVDCVAVQPDGKIIIGGAFTSLQPNGALVSTPRICIARLNADGTLDEGFDPKTNIDGNVLSIVVQPNGKLIIGGNFTTLQPNGAAAPITRNRIARLNEDGTLDTGFDPNANSAVTCIVQQADGKLILGGGFNTLQPNGDASPSTRIGIARVNTDGTLDATFDVQMDGPVECMVQQADGKLVIGGAFVQIIPHGAVSYTSRQFIARLNADLTLDTTFDLKLNSYVFGLAAQTDGKVIFGGSFTTVEPNGGAAITRSCIARSNADGTLDLSFDPHANSTVQSIALQADGKVMIGGGFDALQPNGLPTQTLRFGMARLTNDVATQSLTSTSTRIEWLRGGTSPETQRTTFELSTDGGLSYSMLGNGTRITGGWELTGLTLPTDAQIRARARSSGGYLNGSSSIMETIAPRSGPPAPEVSVIGNLRLIENNDLNPRTADFTDFGNQLSTGTRTFTIQNTGSAALTLSAVTITGANAADFTVTSAPAASVVPSGFTTVTITFNPSAIGLRHARVNFTTNDSDEAAFEFGIQGGGPNSPVTDITLSPSSIVENNLASALVGELTATDADSGDAHSFTLIAGTGDTDNASFSIANNALRIILSTDFETKPSYALRVKADDNIGSTFEKELIVTIANTNDAPGFIKGSDLTQPKGITTAQSLTNWATAITDNDSVVTQTLYFSTVSITGDSIFSIAPTLTTNGTLSYTPNGTVGTATIGITLTDDNTVNGTAALTSPTQTFTITTLPSPNDLDNDGLLDTWETTHFGNTTAHTATDDTDHDGLVELLEEAFGLNPNLADSASQPTATLIGGYLTITITKQPGVTYEVQTCGDLIGFSASATTVLINDAITLQVRDNFLMTAAERFLRVSVTAAP